MRGLLKPQQAAGGVVNHFNSSLAVDNDNSFENRFHHRFLLAYQQANFARFQRKNLFFNTAGKIPGEDKQGDQQQNGGDKNIHHLLHGNAVEIAGQIANGDDADHPSVIIDNGRFTA